MSLLLFKYFHNKNTQNIAFTPRGREIVLINPFGFDISTFKNTLMLYFTTKYIDK